MLNIDDYVGLYPMDQQAIAPPASSSSHTSKRYVIVPGKSWLRSMWTYRSRMTLRGTLSRGTSDDVKELTRTRFILNYLSIDLRTRWG